VNDPDALPDFLAFSTTIVMAHILTHIKDALVTWVNLPGRIANEDEMETEGWVVSCRKGTLAYPRRDFGVWIKNVIPWRDHISNW
jgi:hypothetical protein